MEISKLEGILRKAKKEGWRDQIVSANDERAALEGYYFDRRAADNVIEYIETFLIVPKGPGAGKPFQLLPYQKKEIIEPLFGWMRPSGLRRFRRGYIELPKKNGKTGLAACLCTYMLDEDGYFDQETGLWLPELGSEVYCCANDQEQATLVWNAAADMVEKSDFLSERLEIIRSRYRVKKDNQSWFAAWSSERSSKDGPNIHFVVCDELHEWKVGGREFWRKIRYGGAVRKQPICPLVITTAGDDEFSLCYDQHEYARKVIDGAIIDFAFFGIIYAACKEKLDADPNYWKTEECWKSANPAYEILLSKDQFEDDVKECENDPSAKAAFFRYRLGQWVNSSNPWIKPEDWARNAKAPFEKEESELAEMPCYAGLDLSSVDDLTASALAFPYWNEEFQRIQYKYLFRIYCPEDTIIERDKKHKNAQYGLWKKLGMIRATPGNVIDHTFIFEDLKKDAQQFDLRELRYDRYSSDWIVARLTEELPGVKLIPFGQSFGDMSSPTKGWFAALCKARCELGDNLLLKWMASNAVAHSDAKGNIMLAKPINKEGRRSGSKDKIDGLTAGVMAYAGASVNENWKPKKGIYGSQHFGEIMKQLKKEIAKKDEENNKQ